MIQLKAAGVDTDASKVRAYLASASIAEADLTPEIIQDVVASLGGKTAMVVKTSDAVVQKAKKGRAKKIVNVEPKPVGRTDGAISMVVSQLQDASISADEALTIAHRGYEAIATYTVDSLHQIEQSYHQVVSETLKQQNDDRQAASDKAFAELEDYLGELIPGFK